MKKLLAVLAFLPVLVLSGGAFGQGIEVSRPTPEVNLMSFWPNVGMTGPGLQLGGHLANRPFRITAVTGYVSTVSGGGAGNTVWTFTDGTNTCTATLACTTSASLVAFRVQAVNGAGTGCSYAALVPITVSVSTAGCTTTQPTVRNLDTVGYWN